MTIVVREMVDSQTTIQGEHWSLREGAVYRDGTRVSRRELLALPRDGAVWTWLRAHGVRRPSPSGRSGPTPTDERRTGQRVTLRLAPEAAEALATLARERGVSRSEVVASLVFQASKLRRS